MPAIRVGSRRLRRRPLSERQGERGRGAGNPRPPPNAGRTRIRRGGGGGERAKSLVAGPPPAEAAAERGAGASIAGGSLRRQQTGGGCVSCRAPQAVTSACLTLCPHCKNCVLPCKHGSALRRRHKRSSAYMCFRTPSPAPRPLSLSQHHRPASN